MASQASEKIHRLTDAPFIEGPFSSNIQTLSESFEQADPDVSFDRSSAIGFDLFPGTPLSKIGADYLVRSNVVDPEERRASTDVLTQYYDYYKNLDDKVKEALNHVLGATAFCVYFNRMREAANKYGPMNVDKVNSTQHFMGFVVVRHNPELLEERLSKAG